MNRLIPFLFSLTLPLAAYAGTPPTTETLPACPTGWHNSKLRTLPTTSVTTRQTYSAPAGTGRNVVYVWTDAGNLVAILDGGESVEFDCFAAQ